MSGLLLPTTSVCLRCWSRAAVQSPNVISQSRSVSRTSAINRGIRASRQGTSSTDSQSRPRNAGAAVGREAWRANGGRTNDTDRRADIASRDEMSYRARRSSMAPTRRDQRRNRDEPRMAWDRTERVERAPWQDRTGSTTVQRSRASSNAGPDRDGGRRSFKPAARGSSIDGRDSAGSHTSNGWRQVRRPNLDGEATSRFSGNPSYSQAQESQLGFGGGRRESRHEDQHTSTKEYDETNSKRKQSSKPEHAKSEATRASGMGQMKSGRFPERPSPEQLEDVDPDDVPLPIPYTTASSQFLYGTNTVLAALRARRRKLYHLYIRTASQEKQQQGNQNNQFPILTRLADQAGIPKSYQRNSRLLDKLSEARPHNGVVLEASALPSPPLLSLGKPDTQRSLIPLTLDRQNSDEIAVNGAPSALPSPASSWRNPFILFLDGITDPGNLGNIIRTAHFYGVDAVVVATNTCASLSSPVLAKASAGACEAVPLFALPRPASFIFESAKAGWKVYAAVAPDSSPRQPQKPKQTTSADLSSAPPLASHPCILMLGAEGEGLRDNLKAKADVNLTIERGMQGNDPVDVGVDSMNVAVAAGVLVDAFMRRPERGLDGKS